MKKSIGSKIFDIFNIIFMIFLSITMIYPFLYTLMLSICGKSAEMLVSFKLIPKDVTLISYRLILSSPYLWITAFNSVFRTVIGTLLSVFLTSLGAYALSKRAFPHRVFFTFIIFFTMLFSGGLIPSYLLVKDLGLIDNRFSLILPGLVSAYNLIIMRSFFQQLPISLEESALIDGASELTVLFRIVYPTSMPVLATISLWVAVGHWNSWFDAMIYINSNNKQVLMIMLRRIIQQFNMSEISASAEKIQSMENSIMNNYTPESIRAAMIIATTLPIVIMYPFLQKYFVKGVMIGSIKG